MPLLHSSRLGACVLALAAPLAVAAQPTQPPGSAQPASSSFTVFLNGVPVGAEQIGVVRAADGWTITSSGQIGRPVDLVTRRLQIRYDPDWKPLELTIDATRGGQPLSVHTVVTGNTATTLITNAGQSLDRTDTLEPGTVLLPSPFWGPFEALSARLKTALAGSTIPVFSGPQVQYIAQVGETATEQIQTTARLVEARRTKVTLLPPGLPPLEAEVWSEETGRLLRLSLPAQSLEIVREDIASVASRLVTVSRANDDQVHVAASGFTLAGTISKPLDAGTKRLPAVVLVGGSGTADRDEMVFGIPILGQLAGELADAGFLVLRYDKRGIGQSGGRTEAATLPDFAEDLRAAVKFLSARKDVDSKRIAVVGHSEGGSVAMLAAAKEKRLAALALVAAMGFKGAELNMEQVRHALARSSKSEADKQSTVELQKKIQDAVLTGAGWDGIPPPLRKQADTPWFQSVLAFDPAKVMPAIKQPILIVQGSLDTQVSPSNADRLSILASARKKAGPAEVVRIPGINHLLVPATTGEADEYGRLTERTISPAVANAIAAWLRKALPAPR